MDRYGIPQICTSQCEAKVDLYPGRTKLKSEKGKKDIMMKPSKIIAAVAANDLSQTATALMRMSEILKLHGEQITIAAEQTIQDIEPDDIHVGSKSVKLRGITIPYENLRIITRVPHGGLPTIEDIMAGEACVFDYGTSDRSFLTIVGRETGRLLKMQYAAEAIDVAATSSMNSGTQILLSEDADDECEVVDAAEFIVDDEGISFGRDRSIPWTDISAMTTQGTLSIAVGRQRMVTINEC